MDEAEKAQNPEMAEQGAEDHKKTPQESFGELRKAKDDLEKQLWQAQKEIEFRDRQLNMQSQVQQKPPVEEEDFDYRQLEQDEYPDGKKLVKALNSFNKKMSNYEKKLAEKDQKIQILETVQELDDFKQVVTAENIEKYIKSDEDNSEAVAKAANPLRKVYNLIKKDARYQAELAAKAVKDKPPSQEKQRLEDKESKPRTGSIGVRSEAVSYAAVTSNSKMTREQRAALWQETQACSRR